MAGYVDFKRMGAPPIPVVQIEFVALAGGREVGSGYIPIPGELGFATHLAAEFAKTTAAKRFEKYPLSAKIEIYLRIFIFAQSFQN